MAEEEATGRKLHSPTGAVSGTEEFERETAVMMALPHAVHPMHDNWRTKADALIKQLEQAGWRIVRAGAETDSESVPHVPCMLADGPYLGQATVRPSDGWVVIDRPEPFLAQAARNF